MNYRRVWFVLLLLLFKCSPLLSTRACLGNIIGVPTPLLSEIINHAILRKARAVAIESDHPLSTFFHVLRLKGDTVV